MTFLNKQILTEAEWARAKSQLADIKEEEMKRDQHTEKLMLPKDSPGHE